MSYSGIKKLLAETIGLNADSIGEKAFERVVSSHMKHSGLHDIGSYLELCKTSHRELENLIEKVIVPETWFFRDVEPFIFLKQYVENNWFLINQKKLLRVLSAPCSTGEEPYSIAMTLLETGLRQDQFHIDTVDISIKGLEHAHRGLYGKGAFRGKGVSYQNRYFVNTDEGCKLDERITDLVDFYQDNLLYPTFLAHHEPYHIIFCRNLLIYLTTEARKIILTHLDRLLIQNGLLFTGHSELVFFTQYGYTKIQHPKSFACQKSVPCKQTSIARKVKKATLRTTPFRLGTQKTSKVCPNFTDRGEIPAKDTSESILATVRVLADQGALEQAFSLCGTFLKKHRPNAEAYYLIGLINHALNHNNSAEEYFLKSIYLDPYYYEALIHLSLLYEQAGDTAKSSLFKTRAKRLHGIKKSNIRTTP